MDIDPQKIFTHPLTAGSFGALLSVLYAPGMTWFGKLLNLSAGITCAWFLAPAATELFGLRSPSMQSALSFAIGMFGMSIGAALGDAIRTVKWSEIATGWFKRPGS